MKRQKGSIELSDLLRHLDEKEKKENSIKEVIEEYVRRNKANSPLLIVTPRMEQRQ